MPLLRVYVSHGGRLGRGRRARWPGRRVKLRDAGVPLRRRALALLEAALHLAHALLQPVDLDLKLLARPRAEALRAADGPLDQPLVHLHGVRRLPQRVPLLQKLALQHVDGQLLRAQRVLQRADLRVLPVRRALRLVVCDLLLERVDRVHQRADLLLLDRLQRVDLRLTDRVRRGPLQRRDQVNFPHRVRHGADVTIAARRTRRQRGGGSGAAPPRGTRGVSGFQLLPERAGGAQKERQARKGEQRGWRGSATFEKIVPVSL